MYSSQCLLKGHRGRISRSAKVRVTGETLIQSVTGGTDQTSGECSLGHTIPI